MLSQSSHAECIEYLRTRPLETSIFEKEIYFSKRRLPGHNTYRFPLLWCHQHGLPAHLRDDQYFHNRRRGRHQILISQSRRTEQQHQTLCTNCGVRHLLHKCFPKLALGFLTGCLGLPPGSSAKTGFLRAWSRTSASKKAPLISPRFISHLWLTINCKTTLRANWDKVGEWHLPETIFVIKSGSWWPRRHHLALILLVWSSTLFVTTKRLVMILSGLSALILPACFGGMTFKAFFSSCKVWTNSITFASSICSCKAGGLLEWCSSVCIRFCKKPATKASAFGKERSSANKTSERSSCFAALALGLPEGSRLALLFSRLSLDTSSIASWKSSRKTLGGLEYFRGIGAVTIPKTKRAVAMSLTGAGTCWLLIRHRSTSWGFGWTCFRG